MALLQFRNQQYVFLFTEVTFFMPVCVLLLNIIDKLSHNIIVSKRTVTQIKKEMFINTPQSSTIHHEDFLALFQTQNRICSQYIKIASQKLYLNQAKKISQANDLLQKLTCRQKVKDLSQWDVFSTRDSVILQDESSFNLSNISIDNSKSKIISRKNILGTRTSRDFDGNINDSLIQIQKECSPKTTNLVKKLAEEYKRMKARSQENQKKEKSSKMNEKMIEQLRQKLLLLTKKIEDTQQSFQKLKLENSSLKQQNKDLNQAIFKKSNEINSQKKIKLYEEIANKSAHNTPKKNSQAYSGNFQIFNKLIEEKQKIMNLRYQQIQLVQGKIQQNLFKTDNSCNNCCLMLKKMKNSILTYKKYLEKEAEEFQIMVDSFKQGILAQQKEN